MLPLLSGVNVDCEIVLDGLLGSGSRA